MQAVTNGLRTSALLLAHWPAPAAHSRVEIELTPRSPEQMSAFYEARGFPAPMIELLSKQCFDHCAEDQP